MADQKDIREKYWYLLGDGVYLAGTLITFLLIAFTTYYSNVGLIEFCRQLAIGILIGSELWDLIFGKIVDDDPFYPYGDWYGGWGFKTKMQRYIFDGLRTGTAIGLSLL